MKKKGYLKQLLSESTENCLQEIGKSLDQNTGLYNELLILSKKFYEAKSQARLGAMSYEQWDIIKRQIDLGILAIIDSLEISDLSKDQRQSINDGNLNEALNFFKNALQSVLVSNERSSGYCSVKVKNVSTKIDGTFTIEIDNFFSTSQISKWTTIMSGNLKDVSRVKVIKSKRPYFGKLYSVICKSTNLENVFLIKEKDEKKETERERLTSEFSIDIKEKDLAIRIKSSIDFIAITLGRKEDMF